MGSKLRPAETEREWWGMLKSPDSTFIRSMDDWTCAIRDPRSNPLRGCSDDAIKHFTEHLEFANGGLAHADYGAVVEEMNYVQFRDLWASFGLSMRLFADHEDMKCESKGTCTWAHLKICTSNC